MSVPLVVKIDEVQKKRLFVFGKMIIQFFE